MSVLKQELHISASMISHLKREENGITVNGEKAYVTRLLRPFDSLHISFPTEKEKGPFEKKTPESFSVLYEDEFFLIIDKQAGVSVQPVKDPDEVTLETYLKDYLHISGRPHPVSRLDKMTSGLMTVAKSAYVHELFKRQMHSENYYKEYRALLSNAPEQPYGTICAPIGFCEGSTYARCVREDGAASESRYVVLDKRDNFAYAKLIPVTGRTHQLRVHMAYIGCPLLGDWLYGKQSERMERAALHSFFLRIRHPVTGAIIEVTSPLPKDMQSILNS